ncbi:hypothetical protein [Mucilaginibacter pineti]|nr:hypothetical protein [Mucilaginibacter pineti]
MTAYNQHDYKTASVEFSAIIKQQGYQLSSSKLYDGACIFALNGEYTRSMDILSFLAKERYYANIGHLTSDSDLKNLHELPEWKILISRVKQNQETLPARTKQNVKVALLKAKALLMQDNGKLWGENLWSDNLLVLGNDHTIYSLKILPGSVTADSVIYTKKIADNVLSQTNSSQKYDNQPYAVILTNYLSDSSVTIIHELFHVLQYKHINLNGNPVNYLDEYQARQRLRLEYQALKNALQAVRDKKEKALIRQYVTDALMYRKLRQQIDPQSLDAELQIETSEGLANYTGFVLSSNTDKYLLAINEIDMRESAPTYTRAFPYATGPAYGLLFDYLQMNWKTGLGKVYNFQAIYENDYLHHPINISPAAISKADSRNNFATINRQEVARKRDFDKKISYYTDLFEHYPTLSVLMTDSIYSRSYDMNGTVVLKDKGLVYSNIVGTDITGRNFGSFKMEADSVKKGLSGIFGDFESHKFIFPLPVKIDGNKITGNGFHIQLNRGWVVRKKDKNGNLEIVQQ